MFNAVVVGADLVAAELATMAFAWPTKEAAIVTHYAHLYQTRVRGHMSGRPGLRAITGDARRRVQVDVRRGRTGTVGEVYTDWVAARRHEFGWFGVDSIGRHIPTPPRPAWQPPLERTVDELAAALNAAAPT